MRVRGSDRWRENWRVVAPAGATKIDLGRGGEDDLGTVARVPAATPVVLVAGGVGAGRRCRAFAARHGIDVRREYIALPSAEAPAYLVENDPAPVRLFAQSVLAAPPGAALVVRLGVALLRLFPARASLRLLAPGRVVVGRAT
jgi:hypothetical protein